MKLSIIIPVFNEEKTVAKVLDAVKKVDLGKLEKEVIVVNDGSRDGTAGIVKENIGKSNAFKFIDHTKNRGKGFAVKEGIKNSTGEYLIIQDADMEYNPKFIPLLLEPILEGRSEVVYGTRLRRLPNFKKEEKTVRFLMHYLGNRFLSFLTSFLFLTWITDMETGYKVIPGDFARKIKLNSKCFEFEPEITAKLLKNGYAIKEVSIDVNPRSYKEGKKLNTFRDGLKAFRALLKYRLFD